MSSMRCSWGQRHSVDCCAVHVTALSTAVACRATCAVYHWDALKPALFLQQAVTVLLCKGVVEGTVLRDLLSSWTYVDGGIACSPELLFSHEEAAHDQHQFDNLNAHEGTHKL